MEPASSFFNGSPSDVTAYAAKWAEVQQRFDRASRERAAAALRPTSSRAAERLNQFIDGGGAVVTTGQQAGLFGGPLYTVYKILTAIKLAEKLEQELGILVLPVFWVASEDHDWEEVNHTFAVGPADELLRIRVSSPGEMPVAMSDRRLGSDVETALDALAQTIGKAQQQPEYLNLLRAAYRPGATVAEAFRTTMEALFAPMDLLVADAADPALKTASLPMLLQEAQQPEEHETRLREQTARLVAAGYDAQVPVIPNATNLFYHGPEGRERLYRGDGRWVARESRSTFSPPELYSLLHEDPSRFSPNVFLRPVVESSVFPSLAYVAGPGEISYFAQLRQLFAAAGMDAPVVFPRFSGMLIEPPIGRALGSLPLELEALGAPLHELRSMLARQAMPQVVQSALEDLRKAIHDGYARLMSATETLDPTLGGPLGTNRNNSLMGVANSEQKILRRIKDLEQREYHTLQRVRTHLYPDGTPQERMLNAFPFLVRHGPDVLDRVSARIEFDWNTVQAGQSS